MDGSSESPAEWALRLSKSKGTESVFALAQGWVRTHEQMVERLGAAERLQASLDMWRERASAVKALQLIGVEQDWK